MKQRREMLTGKLRKVRLVLLVSIAASLMSVSSAWTSPPCFTRRSCSKRSSTHYDINPRIISLDATKTEENVVTGDIPLNSTLPRGKVNEIDFCIAPADVSLSRAYGTPNTNNKDSVVVSLTRALNNASNRAVRRILLARSWPSPEALNESLRLVKLLEQQQQQQTGGKCPVPRPILNVLTSRRRKGKNDPSTRTDAQYVQDQLENFASSYGNIAGYPQAEQYLQLLLQLATTGVENRTLVEEIQKAAVYDEAYRRVVTVLESGGIVFEQNEENRVMASTLKDQNICWSVWDQVVHQQHSGSDATAEDETTAVQNQDDTNSTDLGGVLLSSREPTVTRQLNRLANIVQRALLFGGDEELLVLAETLQADREAFLQRWSQPDGVAFLDSMILLLRDCYENGVVSSVDPALPLSNSYANAYERLIASIVEFGSGYLKPTTLFVSSSSSETGVTSMTSLPKPRTSMEELGRFALWETSVRQRTVSPQQPAAAAYPEDLVGDWVVKDMIGGETIGTTTVTLLDSGTVLVQPPLEGLRWRLDPGPTHLDTCTFQVLSSDGTILQYTGFLDRGARLESRFSNRALQIRGSVMFQMRTDGRLDYYKDILPINYRTGTTKFVMTQNQK